MPKPVLIHCDIGFTSAVVATLKVANELGASTSDVLQWGIDFGYNFANQPQIYALINRLSVNT